MHEITKYMGNRTSRNTVPKEQHDSYDTAIRSSNKNSDRQYFNTYHTDTHYNIIDNVLNHHLIIMNSNVNIQQSAMNIHQDSLKLAMKNHINAVALNTSNYQQYHKMIYTL
ncbi:unnamed protein product [Rotaria sordida]|uniref:Uncharacterized protein n=2 Tax=Rotaria sordida TaxID=392033 RepID=A0A813SH10_9BILA|nr:unnamed protein product [Rotaria sordida]